MTECIKAEIVISQVLNTGEKEGPNAEVVIVGCDEEAGVVRVTEDQAQKLFIAAEQLPFLDITLPVHDKMTGCSNPLSDTLRGR